MSSWSGWEQLGGQLAGGEPAAAQNADGRLELFAEVSGPQGPELGHIWQTAPNAGWSAWDSLGAPASAQFLGATAVARNADGRLEAFARVGLMSTGTLWHIWQTTPGGTWSAWEDLGGSIGAHIVVATQNADGRLEVFAVSSTAKLEHIWQTSPNGGWSAWGGLGQPVGVSLTAGVAAGQNPDGRLEVFAVATDGGLWHLWQESPNGDWSGWESLSAPPGVSLAIPAAARNEDGRLEVFVSGQGNLWHRWQPAPGAGWADWAGLGVPPGTASLVAPAVGQNSDGRLEVFAVAGGAVWHIWQSGINNGWSAWESLGGRPEPGVAVGQNADGRLEVFVEDRAAGPHTSWHRWQTSPGGAWSSSPIAWQTSGPAEAMSALAIALDGTLVAAGASGVWRSQDGAASWTKISPTLLGASLSIDPAGGAIWATSHDGNQILASFDGGTTWASKYATSGEGHLNVVLADPNSSGTVWVGMSAPDTLAEVLRSTDNGSTWTPVLPSSLRGGGGLSPTNAGPLEASNGLAGLIVAGAQYYHSGGVLKSADGGATWTLAYGDAYTPLAGASAVAVSGATVATARVYAGLNVLQFGSMVRSINGGATWTDLSNALPVRGSSTGGFVANLVADPQHTDVVYTSMWDTSTPARTGVFVSADGGQSWTELGHLAPRVAGPNGLALNLATQTLYAASDQGVYGYPL